MYASLLILLKFGPEVYSISNRYVCASRALCARGGGATGGGEGVSTRGCFVYAKFNTDSLPFPLHSSSPSLLLADLLFKSGGEWRLSGARVNQSTRGRHYYSSRDLAIFFPLFFSYRKRIVEGIVIFYALCIAWTRPEKVSWGMKNSRWDLMKMESTEVRDSLVLSYSFFRLRKKFLLSIIRWIERIL